MRGNSEFEGVGDIPRLVALAHELKIPLTLIRQLAVTRDYYSDVDMTDALRRIEMTSERALKLVEALTRTYRAHDMESEPVNISQLCQEVIHENAPLFKEIGREVQLHAPRQSVIGVAHRDLLKSVLFGLCDNALSYGSGGTSPIDIKVTRRLSTARTSIIDHGPSMTRQERMAMVGKLGKAPTPLGSRPNSSGLGLYIAQQFASAMQGQLGFKQLAEGKQATFIEVPRSAQLSLLGI